MQIAFVQVYTDAGRAKYYFSSPYWQGFMRESVSGLGMKSKQFEEKYPGYNLVIYVDARADIDAVQLRGIDLDKKRKWVETGLILPHPGARVEAGEAHRPALQHLFHGIDLKLRELGFDTGPLIAAAPAWIDQIVADSAMFRPLNPWE